MRLTQTTMVVFRQLLSCFPHHNTFSTIACLAPLFTPNAVMAPLSRSRGAISKRARGTSRGGRRATKGKKAKDVKSSSIVNSEESEVEAEVETPAAVAAAADDNAAAVVPPASSPLPSAPSPGSPRAAASSVGGPHAATPPPPSGNAVVAPLLTPSKVSSPGVIRAFLMRS